MHFNEHFEYSINYLSCIVFSDELTNLNCRQNVTIFYLYYLVFQRNKRHLPIVILVKHVHHKIKDFHPALHIALPVVYRSRDELVCHAMF